MDPKKLERLTDRMKVQMKLSWAKEEKVLLQNGLSDGMAVLEIGSGPGYITEQLLKRLPTSKITSVEIDPDFVEFSTGYLADKAGGRSTVIKADILETGLPDASFDFAIARLVFQHISDPQAAAKEIMRMLKPGGKLVVLDVDDAIWGIVDPMVPELAYVLDQHAQEQKSEGGNRFIGRQLWRILKSAGFAELDLGALVVHSDEIGIDPFLPQIDLDEMRTMVTSGFITEEDVQRVQSAFRNFLQSPYPYAMLQMLTMIGVKPESGTAQ